MSAREAGLTALEFIDPHLSAGAGQRHEVIRAVAPRPLAMHDVGVSIDDLRIDGAGRTHDVTEWLSATYATSLIVLWRGRVMHEWYADGLGPHTLFLGASMTKSVLSHLVGMAVLDGSMSLRTPVTELVSELAGTGWESCTVDDVITMTSGVHWVEDHRDPDGPASRLVRTFTDGDGSSRAMLTAVARGVGPGRQFIYNTADSQVLDWARERATGRCYPKALASLWAAMGATHDAVVSVDADGHAMAGGGLAATTRDWARVGLLALDGKVAGDDRPIRMVDQVWMHAATTPAYSFLRPGRLPSSISTHVGFARHWWPLTSDGGRFAADGSRGQFILVDRSRDVVLVKTSAWPHADIEVDRQCRDLSYLGLQEIASALGVDAPGTIHRKEASS